MIKLFKSDDTLFATNGDKIIEPLKAIVTKEDNGAFNLKLETNLDYIDDLVSNKILVAPTPQGEQAFRISSVEKTRSKISLTANHIFFDTNNYFIKDSYIYQKNCNDALDHLNSTTDNISPFTMFSDVASRNSYRCVRTSLYEAINVVLDRWGGHLLRDNFNIGIKDEIGADNGVVVRYKKNLKNISCKELWDGVVTKLMPVGQDGLLLPEEYVYSDKQYEIPFTKTVSFNQEIDREQFTDAEGNVDEIAYKDALIEDLRSQAQLFVNENCYPKVNYSLKSNLEKISDIGDKIEVIDERLGIHLITNLISFTYDCIADKYLELEFGNYQRKLSNLLNDIKDQTNKIVDDNNQKIDVILKKELADANEKIWNALSSSYVVYEGDKILVLDRLPKETAQNVIMINSGGIGFSQTGIHGTFRSAWTIDNILNMEQINVINLTADLIKGGTLKLGSNLNEFGVLELYDESNTLIGQFDKRGLKMYGTDGSYVLLNNEVGFAGYDKNDKKIYWADKDEFHMKKSVVEEEITICNKFRWIPISVYNDENKLVNDGIGLVSTPGGKDEQVTNI